jgi:hypothetical protein
MKAEVKTEKGKVSRTHSCVIDTHKKSLEVSVYFMSFLSGIEPSKDRDNEVQGICPHCSAILDIYKDVETAQENSNKIKCKSCEVEYSADKYKFVADGEGRGGRYQKRETQWVKQVEFFLSNGEILHIRPYITTSFIKYSKKSEKYVVAKQTHIYKMAFNLRTGLSYFLECIDGSGKTFEVHNVYGVASFKRSKGAFPVLLKDQAENYDVIRNVFTEISFMIKDIIKETPFSFNEDGLENVKSFLDLSVWNRLKQVDSKREDFYSIVARNFLVPDITSDGPSIFLSKNSSYIVKMLRKEKNGTFEEYVNNISRQTKSGKVLKKEFYKNPLNIRYNYQLYRLGMKDGNRRLTFLNTLNKLAFLTTKKTTIQEELEFQKTYYNLVSFFFEILNITDEKKVNSLIKQLGVMIKGFEVLYNIEQGNFSNLQAPINFDNFVYGSFDIHNYRGTKMLEKFSMFNETMSLYYRLKDSIEELNEAPRKEFQDLIESSFAGKNFYEIHENLSSISSSINTFKEQTPIEYSEDDLRYEGIFGDYEFFLPEKVVDFAKFGREFRNCVGSYAQSVSRKECLIVIARDAKTKDLKLCIEISGDKNPHTKDKIRCSFQYKSFFNNRPKQEDLPSLIEWYKTLNIDNSYCYDIYWDEAISHRDPQDISDFDLPF